MKYTILFAVVMLALCASASFAWTDDLNSPPAGDFWLSQGPGGYGNAGYVDYTPGPYEQVGTGNGWVATWTPQRDDGSGSVGIDNTGGLSGFWNAYSLGQLNRDVEPGIAGFYISAYIGKVGVDPWAWSSGGISYIYLTLQDPVLGKSFGLYMDTVDGPGGGPGFNFSASAAGETGWGINGMQWSTWYDFYAGVDLVNGEFTAKYKKHSDSTWTVLGPSPGHTMYLPAGFNPTYMNFYMWGPTILDNAGTVVPEPGSVLALGSGLIGLLGFAIRRRK